MGCSTVELCDRFDSRELARWWTYYQVEPWGWKIENKRFGQLANLLDPKTAAELPSRENWFTDELPEIKVFDDEDEPGDAAGDESD